MNVFDLFGKVSIDGLDKTKGQLTGLEKNVQRVQQGMKIMGAAFTAVGVAGLVMIQSTKKINAQLSMTALNLGVTTKEMRNLTLETTNVTFPIKEVTATFDLLARAGVKDQKVLKDTATAFDTLGDATGYSASQVTKMMIPAMKTFGLTATEMAGKTDLMTYMSRKSTMTMEDFNTMVGYTTPELVKAGLTMEELTAILIHMEKQGYAPGRVMTREFMKATTLATKEQIPLYEAIGMTSEELKGYQRELIGATGLTQEYADVANEQYTIMDKLKQKWSELTLMTSEYLEPLEPILAGMTALGPMMIGISMVGLPALGKAIKAVGHALKTLLLNPITALIASLALLGFGIYSLIKHYTDWNKIVDAAGRLNDELFRSGGKVTQGVLDASEAYIGLRGAYGQLTPEEEAHIERLKEMIGLYKDGTLKIERQTESLYARFYAFTEGEGIVTSATQKMGKSIFEWGQYSEEVISGIIAKYGEVADAIELTVAERFEEHRAILLEKEALKELNTEMDLEIEKRNDLLGIISQQLAQGASLADLANLAWELTPFAGTAAGAAMGFSGLGITIPGLQGGGIITKPTLALLGEQAPRVKEFVFNEKQLDMLWGTKIPEIVLPKFKEGGIIPEPTLLYGLRSQRPYAIAGESGIEHVGQGTGGGITVNIIEPHVRNDRDIDLMGERLVARLRQKGIKL